MVQNLDNDTTVDHRKLLDFLRGLSDSMPESIMITATEYCSAQPTILYVNRSFTALTGYTLDEAVGKTPKLLQGPQTERAVLDRLKIDLSEREQFHGRTYNYRKNGEAFLMDWEIVPFHTESGRKSFYLTVQREIPQEADVTSACFR